MATKRTTETIWIIIFSFSFSVQLEVSKNLAQVSRSLHADVKIYYNYVTCFFF